MKTIRLIFVIISVSCAVLSGCKEITALINKGLRIARAEGVIDKDTQKVINDTGKVITNAAETSGKKITNVAETSGKAMANAVEDITPEQEYYIGRAVAANVLKTYSLWKGSPALTAYANRICNAIVINSSKPDIYNGYHVAILDSKEINAFATSGGHIFLTRGLVSSAKSEDALAGVIAHEIAHIQLQHSIKAIKTSRFTQAIMTTGAAAAGAVSGYDMNEMMSILNESVGDIVGALVNNGYSQAQEFEADAKALSLLAGAGYNPGGLIEMLKELEKTQKDASGGFNKTHPSPETRRAAAEKVLLLQLKPADTSSYRKARFINK